MKGNKILHFEMLKVCVISICLFGEKKYVLRRLEVLFKLFVVVGSPFCS